MQILTDYLCDHIVVLPFNACFFVVVFVCGCIILVVLVLRLGVFFGAVRSFRICSRRQGRVGT